MFGLHRKPNYIYIYYILIHCIQVLINKICQYKCIVPACGLGRCGHDKTKTNQLAAGQPKAQYTVTTCPVVTAVSFIVPPLNHQKLLPET